MIEFRIKEKTRSLNESFRGDWRPRAAAAKRQRTKAMQACPMWPGGPLLVVRLTRVSPGTLDSDALPAALKHVRDGVADRLKVDDASPLVAWEYHQAKGEAEVVVQIWKAGEADPSPPEGRPVGVSKSLRKASTVKGKLKPGSNSKGREFYGTIGKPPFTVRVKSTGYDPERPPMGMGHAVDRLARMTPQEERKVAASMVAAREAEETFAPAPRVLLCSRCQTQTTENASGLCLFCKAP